MARDLHEGGLPDIYVGHFGPVLRRRRDRPEFRLHECLLFASTAEHGGVIRLSALLLGVGMQVTIGSTASSAVELMVSGGVGIVWSMAWTWLSSLARWSTAT